jgi:tetratricopeptide (TPR) repeat protein
VNYGSRVGILCLVLLIIVTNALSRSAIAKTQTFMKEYTYQAGEADSKLSSRAIALEQIKRLLLEELGTYLESHTEIADFRLRKDQITALSAGVVQTSVLQESWDGNRYWLRAKIEADPDEVYRAIGALRKDFQRMRELEETRKKVEHLSSEIDRLQKELKTDRTNTVKKEQYVKAARELHAVDIFQNGIKLAITGKIHAAIVELSNTIKKEPKYALAYITRGHLYARLGNNQRAIKDADRAIELDPRSALAYASRAYIFYRLGGREKILEDANRAIEIDPQFTYAYLLRSNYFYRSGNFSEALKNAEKAVQLDPSAALAYSTRGAIQAALGNAAQSAIDIDKALALDSNCAEVVLARAELHANNGGISESLALINRAIELDPYLGASHAQRCYMYTKMKNYHQALIDCNKAVELAPQYNPAYAYRGAVYHSLGKDDKAIDDWKTAARLGNSRIQKVLLNKGVTW